MLQKYTKLRPQKDLVSVSGALEPLPDEFFGVAVDVLLKSVRLLHREGAILCNACSGVTKKRSRDC